MGSSGKRLGSQHPRAESVLAWHGGQDEQSFWRRAVMKEGGRHLKGRHDRQRRPRACPRHTRGQPQRRASFLVSLPPVKPGSSTSPSLSPPCPGSCSALSEAELLPSTMPSQRSCRLPGRWMGSSLPVPQGWHFRLSLPLRPELHTPQPSRARLGPAALASEGITPLSSPPPLLAQPP